MFYRVYSKYDDTFAIRDPMYNEHGVFESYKDAIAYCRELNATLKAWIDDYVVAITIENVKQLEGKPQLKLVPNEE